MVQPIKIIAISHRRGGIASSRIFLWIKIIIIMESSLMIRWLLEDSLYISISCACILKFHRKNCRLKETAPSILVVWMKCISRWSTYHALVFDGQNGLYWTAVISKAPAGKTDQYTRKRMSNCQCWIFFFFCIYIKFLGLIPSSCHDLARFPTRGEFCPQSLNCFFKL